jgi:pSer/pThr/pTyr-binding forkhead associated (FHA) protein
MDERTEMAPNSEVTAALAPVTCPVCGASNAALETWCADCGFLLEDKPGENVSMAPGWTLTDGSAVYRLKTGENVVGRLNADVFLSDPSVSRRHAVLTVTADGVSLRDERSSNGTRVNGAPVAAEVETPLEVGARIEFGSVRLTLVGSDGEIPEPAAEPEPEAGEPPVARLAGDAGVFALRPGANTIGRREGNAVTIADPFVSGLHAVISIEGRRASLTDSGSTNGTFVGDERLASGVTVELEDGSSVRFGQVVLRFEWLPEPAPEPAE